VVVEVQVRNWRNWWCWWWRRWFCWRNGTADNGTVNTGGGGGGLKVIWFNGGAGGKGVVILSMPLASFSGTTTGSPTESDDGTTKVLIFNGDGSYTA
jgi:hypothetical protein